MRDWQELFFEGPEHAGFRLPDTQSAYDAMSPGWSRVLERVDQVTREAR